MNIRIKQNGRYLETYEHASQTYLLVPSFGPYTIEVHNNSSRRVEVVLSVDGLSIMNGQPASVSDRGYVIDAHRTVEIPGWRRDDREVAKFEFSEKEQSYSAVMGKGTENTSVIGAAFFLEKEKPWAPPPVYRVPTSKHMKGGTFGSSGGAFGSSRMGASKGVRSSSGEWSCSIGEVTRGKFDSNVLGSRDLGTGYGAAASFNVGSTSFDRASTSPDQVITLRYGTREKLESWGVVFKAGPSTPVAFPADGCPAPANWHR